MASLNPTELGKRNNIAIFLQRIRANKSFTIANNGGKTVKIDKVVAKMVSNVRDLEKFREGRSIVLPTSTPKGFINLTQLYKDSEFSGRTQRTTAAEDKEVVSLTEQLKKVMDSTGTDSVNVKVGKNRYTVTSVISTRGTPKSDFSFVDTQGNAVGHMSHKDGTNPRGFQQWAGTSQRVEPKIYAHPETQDFINTLKKMFPDGMPPATTVGRKIKDPKLKKMAVYGSDYGSRPGVNNVDATLQGELKLVKRGSYYQVTASIHEDPNGANLTGGYEPIFLAVYKGDRSDHGIKSARITINPLGGRTVKQYV